MSDEDELTGADRELEAALRTLRPAPARISPVAATRGVGKRSVVGRPWSRASVRRLAIAAAIAAVVGAWWLSGLHRNLPRFVHQHMAQLEKKLIAFHETAEPPTPPTLLAYRQALAQSPDELDALLARQGAVAASPSTQFTPVGLPTLWNPDASRSLGKM